MNDNEDKYLKTLCEAAIKSDSNYEAVSRLNDEPIETMTIFSIHLMTSNCNVCSKNSNCIIQTIGNVPLKLNVVEARSMLKKLKTKILAIPRPISKN